MLELKPRYLLKSIYFLLLHSPSQILSQDIRGLNPPQIVEDGYGRELESAECMSVKTIYFETVRALLQVRKGEKL